MPIKNSASMQYVPTPSAGRDVMARKQTGLLDRIAANWNKQGGMQGLLDALSQDATRIGGKIEKGVSDVGATMRLPHGTPPEAYDAVTGAAMNTMGLGYGPAVGRMAMGAKYDPSTMRMFFGEGAKTADKAVLKKAKAMEKKGATRDEIWKATAEMGQPWRKDGDGKWKFEVSDRGAELAPDLTMSTVGKNLAHDELYDADPGAARASYIPTTSKEIMPGEGAWYGPPTTRYGELVLRPSDAPGINKSTTLHELQHNVQGREGFSEGGGLTLSPAERGDLIRKTMNDIKAEDAKSGSPSLNIQEKATEIVDSYDGRFAAYLRRAGEAEARNVEERMNMTMKQRGKKPPWKTLDVPEDEIFY